MKAILALPVVALALACSGQEPPSQVRPVAATASVQTAPAPAVKRLELNGVAKIESAFEQRLTHLDPADSFELMGACSGVYVSGYGLVFTTPLSLIVTPKPSPFTAAITKQSTELIHKRKLAHLPALRQAMSEMLIGAAKQLDALPPNEKVVVAARLFYMDYEDKAGLPSQIVMTADRASALAGAIQTEEQ